MNVEQRIWQPTTGWKIVRSGELVDCAQVAFVFANYAMFEEHDIVRLVRSVYPEALLIGCSASAVVHGNQLDAGVLLVSAIRFDDTEVRLVQVDVPTVEDSYTAGRTLAERLNHENLCHAFIISDGLQVDATALSQGISSALEPGISVTGGLASDDDQFERTLVLANDTVREKQVAAIGFYGENLLVGYGCGRGWDAFGTARKVTRSEGCVLYEIDHQPALELYKKYLGEFAEGLPATALYFPLNIQKEDGVSHLIRAVLSVNDADGSLIFGGDIPEGSCVTLMKSNLNRLIDGAEQAGKCALDALVPNDAAFSIVVNCVARRIVLKQRAEEEIEAVADALGSGVIGGFYSFGEIGPAKNLDSGCELHNQTMTITTFCERDE